MASAVRPEVKLKAILEITRSLSNELRIDAVAPKILDSLMEIFPGAERLFLMLQDPSTKRLVRKAFKYRPQKRTSFVEPYPRTRSRRASAGRSSTTCSARRRRC